ncbi:ATP-grasp domain-containing protein [Brachybacterium phenoliresistens]|uniref:Carboxylate--amine ligase n=1 Tax=Brachybacterium phenoliresistens TaxID=396014 RepID=Z9JP03_9MICO|nr:ATP-grasp domain-containing protein [Brachybacterium phenoliresistens]EWS79919.1 carboxylate--amine ligase [Brachybacterium phenoliresistens]
MPETAPAAAPAPDFDLVLVGSGLGIYAFARAFHEQYGTVATIVTKVGLEPMRRSVACDLVELGSSAGDADMVGALVDLAVSRGGVRPQLLLCNADSVVQLLSDHREALEPHYEIPILDAETLDRVSDKAEFALLCEAHGVHAPHTEIVDMRGIEDAEAAEAWQPPTFDIPFPLVMKAAKTADMASVRFAAKKKVWFVQSPEELDELLRTIARAGYRGRLVVQELIPGDDTAMCSITAYVDQQGRVTLLTSARVLLEEHTPDALGRPAAMITTELPEALEQARRMLEATGWRGFANFDVKEDPRDGVLKFFEVNPRIGRNLHYNTAAGANVSRVVVADRIEHREIEPLTRYDEILYSLVPLPLLLRYVTDPAQRRWVRTVARRGTANPWAYPAEGAWAKRYAWMVALNHVKKFLRYYPRPTSTGF